MGSEPCGDTWGPAVSPPPPLRGRGDVRWPKPPRGLGIMGARGKGLCVLLSLPRLRGTPKGCPTWQHPSRPRARGSPAGDGAESKQAAWNSAFPADGSADSVAPLTINRECCWVGPSCTLAGHRGCSWGQLRHTGRCAQGEPRRVSPPSPHFQS